MIFLYRCQGKDGKLIEGEVRSSSEAEAYSDLRKSGIRPMKVWPKPGLVNRIAAIGKRGLAIIVLAGAVIYFGVRSVDSSRQPAAEVAEGLAALPRRDLPPTAVDFDFESERVLAMFARPGDAAIFAATNEAANAELFASDLAASLDVKLRVLPTDSEDAVALKRIVSGMKDECRMAIACGDSAEVIYKRLCARQRMEVSYREGLLRGLKMKSSTLTLEEANSSLRAMGQREIATEEL